MTNGHVKNYAMCPKILCDKLGGGVARAICIDAPRHSRRQPDEIRTG